MDRAAVRTALFARLDPACMAQRRQDLAFDPAVKRIARLEAVAPVFMAMAREAMRASIAAQAAEQIERAKRVAPPEHRDQADFGTTVRRRRGELVQEERPDVSSEAEYKPTIRGARRYDPLRVFLGIRNVAKPHDGAPAEDARRWTAAQAFRALVEIAGGARVGDRPLERVDGTMAPGGYTDRMLDAIGAVRRLTAAMGESYPAVRWMVEEYGGIDEYAVVAGLDESEAQERLTMGLDVLVDEVDASAARVIA